MKRIIGLLIFAVVFASMLVVGLVSRSANAGIVRSGRGNEKRCTLDTLEGDYVMTGRRDSTEGVSPRIIAGVAVFDGEGGLTGRETTNTSGEVERITYDGTYTLQADCTGTVTVGTAQWDLVVTKDGTEGVLISTTPGRMTTRTIKKQ